MVQSFKKCGHFSRLLKHRLRGEVFSRLSGEFEEQAKVAGSCASIPGDTGVKSCRNLTFGA